MVAKRIRARLVTRIVVLGFLLSGCNGIGGDGSNSATASDNSTVTAVSLGVLNNGSVVQSSSGSFILASGQTTTGTIGISGGEAGYTGVMTMVVGAGNSYALYSSASNLPTVSLSPNPCILSAGDSSHLDCQYTITTMAAVANETYTITPIFTPNGSIPQLLNSITLTTTDGATPKAGYLSVILDDTTLSTGESSVATIALSGSVGVFNLPVSVTSSDVGILNIAQSACMLSTENNSCQVHMNALAPGNTTLKVSANGYDTVTSNQINIGSGIVPGNISLTLESAILQYGQSITATVKLVNSTKVESVTVDVSSQDTDIATVAPEQCVLSSTNNTCTIIIQAGSSAYSSGTTNIIAIANGYTAAQAVVQVHPVYGTLSLSMLAPNLAYGKSTVATASVSGSVGVKKLHVYFSSDNPTIATINPESCVILSSDKNTCSTTITVGSQTGAANITAWADGYSPAQFKVSTDKIIQYVYVTNMDDNTISMYSINSTTGQLAHLTPALVQTAAHPRQIIVANSGKNVYVTNWLGNSVGVYKIDSDTGILNGPIQEIEAESSPYALTTDLANKYLYVTNQKSKSISIYSIDAATGVLTALKMLTVATDGEPLGITFDSSGRYVYVVDSSNKSILMYNFESDTGQLVPLAYPAKLYVGNCMGAVGGIKITPSGKYAYAIGEVSEMCFLTINSTNGRLDRGVEVFTAGSNVDLVFTPSGKYAYAASNHPGRVLMYGLDSIDYPDRLYPQTIPTDKDGIYSTSLRMDKAGKYLYTANYNANTISMYSSRESDGQLVPLAEPLISAGSNAMGMAIN